MRYLQIFSIVLFIFMPNTPLAAQEHQHHAQTQANPPGFEQYLRLYGYDRRTPLPPGVSAVDKLREQLGLPPLEAQAGPQKSEESRFSYWGYRHAELHKRGVIGELLERTQGKNCCNGVMSGECRISKVNLQKREAYVDGDWCPIDKDTRVTPLDSLANMTDGDEEIAVVCASQKFKKCETTTYCIGIKPPKV